MAAALKCANESTDCDHNNIHTVVIDIAKETYESMAR